MGKIIKKEDVMHISELAEIEYSADEIDKITTELDKIIKHVAKISEADTNDVTPTSHVLDMANVLREDEPRKSIDTNEALKNAPESSDNGFKVPKID
jgi:aspartyl-tRNA(Asn)/glutamyl-tRNA(Gln) amidotransferase subunit C